MRCMCLAPAEMDRIGSLSLSTRAERIDRERIREAKLAQSAVQSSVKLLKTDPSPNLSSPPKP